ncbi:uncharacterized protein DUF2726 [Pseudoduganella flava]|uniref:DUF2726 domain-containing protein n=1 Tax=Pseudoduganella flava TaxID=871742 RepID=A0A562PJJ6_9BURK|nr:DUF2726 domain-containing protein [Pseudoduganella flava]QGZ41976.1 DUF2726 domain-containing protein [Pseudoduganella flava]TWI44390.1 uncharacterized protein DUF2726 [Pseudoduganella flava]
MKTSFLLLVVVALAAAFLLALLKGAKGSGRTGAYRRRKLMTDNEEEFFGRLVVALPDHYIFPQVAMSALLEPASGNSKTAYADRLRVAQQRVDYVVCTKRCEVVAVVELDDKTHTRSKDTLRDARLEQGGIRTVRFQARHKPKVEAIRAMILGPIEAEAGKETSMTSQQTVSPIADTSRSPQ